MKKKYLSYLLLLIFTGLWSCKSEDDVFEQTADERLNESIAAYLPTSLQLHWFLSLNPPLNVVISCKYLFHPDVHHHKPEFFRKSKSLIVIGYSHP